MPKRDQSNKTKHKNPKWANRMETRNMNKDMRWANITSEKYYIYIQGESWFFKNIQKFAHPTTPPPTKKLYSQRLDQASATLKRATSSILTSRKTIDKFNKNTSISVKGRHDPCVGIRAVPVGEAMVACVLADHFLRNRAQIGN